MTMTTLTMPNQSTKPQITRLSEGNYFFEWNCAGCFDSGVAKTLLGYEPCTDCRVALDPISFRLYGALSLLQLKQKPIDSLMLTMARALVSASSQEPLQGEALAFLMQCSERIVKKRRRD